MENTVKILGVSDETHCECCGRTNLKKTIKLSLNGRMVFYGETCALRAIGVKASKKSKESDLMKEARTIQKLRECLEKGMEPEKACAEAFQVCGMILSYWQGQYRIQEYDRKKGAIHKPIEL
jgi:hypothetical protein